MNPDPFNPTPTNSDPLAIRPVLECTCDPVAYAGRRRDGRLRLRVIHMSASCPWPDQSVVIHHPGPLADDPTSAENLRLTTTHNAEEN